MLECAVSTPSFEDDARLSLVPPHSLGLQESVNSLVVCLLTHFEAIWSKLGDPSLRVAFVKSSANTLAGGRIPTVIVEIKPAGVFGVGGLETGVLCIFCLLRDCQMVYISPSPSK